MRFGSGNPATTEDHMSEAESIPQCVPHVGRWPEIDHDIYLAWEASSNSRLQHMRRSPAACKWQIDHPGGEERTPQQQAPLDLGAAVHCCALQPELFEALFALRPEGNANSTAFREARAELLALGFTILTQKQWDTAQAIRDSLYDEPSAARDLLLAADAFEVSYVAEHPELPVLCKTRPDLMIHSGGIMGELKTARDITPEAFAKACWNLGYARGKALYLDVANVIDDGHWTSHVFVCVQNTPPFEVVVYELDEISTAAGRAEAFRLLERYGQCEASGVWPGMEREIQPLSLPEWVLSREGF
jgi:hypothetical protein